MIPPKKTKKDTSSDSLLGAITTIEFGPQALNFALLLIRLVVAFFLLKHGIDKLKNFNDIQLFFPDPLRLGTKQTLILSIILEILGGTFILFGLFTRIIVLPLIIQMIVIVFFVHFKEIFKDGELAIFYLAIFLLLFFIGPGAYSIDGQIQHRMGNDHLENDESDF